jgi:hypothetical protein
MVFAGTVAETNEKESRGSKKRANDDGDAITKECACAGKLKNREGKCP